MNRLKRLKKEAAAYLFIVRWQINSQHSDYAIGIANNFKKGLTQHLIEGYEQRLKFPILYGVIYLKSINDAKVVKEAIHNLEMELDEKTVECIVKASGGTWLLEEEENEW